MARGTPREPYQGKGFTRAHPLIGNMSILPDGSIDKTFAIACTRPPLEGGVSLDELFMIEDIDNVSRSWHDAYQANAELRAQEDANAHGQ